MRARFDASGKKRIGVREMERRGKMGKEKMTDSRNARGRTRGRPANDVQVFLVSSLFRSRDRDKIAAYNKLRNPQS
jgi:hypothetical protein